MAQSVQNRSPVGTISTIAVTAFIKVNLDLPAHRVLFLYLPCALEQHFCAGVEQILLHVRCTSR